MSMWPPRPFPSGEPSDPGTCGVCCCCSPAHQCLASPPPPMARTVEMAPAAWGKPNCQNSSHLSTIQEAGCCPASAFSVSADSAQNPPPREPSMDSLTHPTWAQPGALPGHQYLLPPSALSLGRWPAACFPRLGATTPSRPSLTQPRTNKGPSAHIAESCLLCLPDPATGYRGKR